MRKVLVVVIVIVSHVALLGLVYFSGEKGDVVSASETQLEDSRPNQFPETTKQPVESEGLDLVTSTEAVEVTHTVKRGDYLSTIARRYGISLSKLCEHNNITDPSRIRIGQKLIIPTAE